MSTGDNERLGVLEEYHDEVAGPAVIDQIAAQTTLTGKEARPPCRTLNAGLRLRLFPGGTASLLPGLPAADPDRTSTGMRHELTNTKIHHCITSRCYLPLCLAHKKTGLTCSYTTAMRGGRPESEMVRR